MRKKRKRKVMVGKWYDMRYRHIDKYRLRSECAIEIKIDYTDHKLNAVRLTFSTKDEFDMFVRLSGPKVLLWTILWRQYERTDGKA